MDEKNTLKLKGNTAVFIDWANVHGWNKSLKSPVDPNRLYKHLQKYKQIESIEFYYGKDQNRKSKTFHMQMRSIGFKLITKPVKYIDTGSVGENPIKKRKCDFDIEICMSVYKHLNMKFDGFIFFSRDGDFEPLYRYLIRNKKQVIVIYCRGHLGKEIYEISKKIYKIDVRRLDILKQNDPA